jgi:MFS family permease
MAGSLLRSNRSYRLHFAASAISNLGDGVSVLALPWLATLLTRDPVLIALVVTGARLPWFLFALPVGVWTDRADRRRIMVTADVVRTALTLGIVALTLALPGLPAGAGAGPGPVLVLAALAFLLGTAEVFRDNAAQTLMPSIVAPGDLERANGRMWSAEQVMNQFVGPPLAGALIAVGIAWPFGLDAATFAIAAALVAGLKLPPRRPPPRRSFRADLSEGLVWLWGQPLIRRLAVILGLTNAVYTAAMAMLALYAQELLGLTSVGMGLLLTAGAAGGVTAGLVGPWIARRIGATNTTHLGILIFGASYLALGLCPCLPVAVVALFGDAFGGVLWNVVTVSYRQRVIPPDLLGRVNAVYRFLGWGMMPVGALAGGVAVRLLEPLVGRESALTLPFLFAGLFTFLLAAYCLVRIRFPD